MSRRIDHATASKVAAALSARAAFGDRFAYHSALLAGLLLPLVDAVFERPLWQTREHQNGRMETDRRVSVDRAMSTAQSRRTVHAMKDR